ncbi:unnamed protein product [Sympodiomycopsis kandeliae]
MGGMTPDSAFTEAYRVHKVLSSSSSSSSSSPEDDSSVPNYLPLSEIPYSLELLELPSNDSDILSVFANGAQTLSSSGNRRGKGIEVISRDDYKQVVEILLMDRDADPERDEEEDEEEEEEPEGRRRPVRRRRQDQEEEEEEMEGRRRPVRRRRGTATSRHVQIDSEEGQGEDSDEYQQDLSSESEYDSDSEVQPKPKSQLTSARRRPTRHRTGSDTDESSSTSITPSKRRAITSYWTLLTTKLDEIDPTWRENSEEELIGRKQLERLLIIIGEKKTSQSDIDDMLFVTSHHEQMVSKELFGKMLVRARIV